ncbi:MAG TPA: FAD-dependent thymidylate synthase [Paracoccaceae bacterium]|nr:FAD-dependent thymidylate synthase [Paracoccaceae bacterium]
MSHTASLVWITPDAEELLVRIARVSNPQGDTKPAPHLIRYMIEHGHVSPFEMVNLCIEVETTRDIGRQMLRHWSMRPQEFSQRYADVARLGEPIWREARMQHPSNRQASAPCEDTSLETWWNHAQRQVWTKADAAYQMALELGIAKEVARAVLPEGLTPSRLYFNANLRSAIHFCQARTIEAGAQTEIVRIAGDVRGIIAEHFPQTSEALGWQKSND